jgi:hypothetical protein
MPHFSGPSSGSSIHCPSSRHGDEHTSTSIVAGLAHAATALSGPPIPPSFNPLLSSLAFMRRLSAGS